MPMTAAEISAINQKAMQHLQQLLDNISSPSGAARGLALEINPDTQRRLKRPRIVAENGQWFDLDGGDSDAHGDDIISLVAWVADCDREEAAIGLRDFLRRQGPPAPSVDEIMAERRTQSLQRAEPSAPMAPIGHRSLRRV